MTLTLPARPEYVHIARSVAAGLAAKAAMTLDDIEDIRLAVDEACSHLLAHSRASELRLDLLRDGPSFEIAVHVDSEIDDGEGRDGSISWRILEALADSVLIERNGAEATIRMAKRIT